MSMNPLLHRAESGLADPDEDNWAGAILQAQASIAIDRWLLETPGVAGAFRRARRAGRAEVRAGDAHARAVRKLQRQQGRIRQMLLSKALASSAPAKVDPADWAAALEQAVQRLFPAS
jgi:hypothetical protein